MDAASIELAPVAPDELGPTDNLFQSPLWARFRSRIGTPVESVQLGSPNTSMLVQLEDQGDFRLAYVAAGPDVVVQEDEQGRFLEELSVQLRPRLRTRPAAEPIAVRYDLPWESPWGDPSIRPSVRAREIRMNFGTDRHRLQKAATDRLAPDTIEIDLRLSEDELLGSMRPKTRYNVRLSGRKGVRVSRADVRHLASWHELYTQTAARKRFRPQSLDYFRTLFDLAAEHRPDVRLYLAHSGPAMLGGIVVVHIGTTATYLYGASAAAERSLMAPDALQWHAIAEARRAGCRRYDLFGVPPAPDAGHPMYGLYRFKTGFGGRLVHRRGAWDYVYDRESYALYEAAEAAARGYYVDS